MRANTRVWQISDSCGCMAKSQDRVQKVALACHWWSGITLQSTAEDAHDSGDVAAETAGACL